LFFVPCLALRDGIDIGARPEGLVGILRVVLYMYLHGTFLPQLAFGERGRLPDDSCGGGMSDRTTIRG
jgi:hypothetical protein